MTPPESEPVDRRSEGVNGDGTRGDELRPVQRGLHVAADLHPLGNVGRRHLRHLHEALDLQGAPFNEKIILSGEKHFVRY